MPVNLLEAFVKIALDTSEIDVGIDGAKERITSGLGTAAKAAGAALAGASTAVVAFTKTAVDAGMGFDSSISQVAATMGKTLEEMESDVGTVDLAWGTFSGNLREYAQEMGANTAFSAKEAADALNYMALAGYDTQTSMRMLPNVLNLAAAGGIDLALASDMVTDAQSALGLSLDETSDMVDQMAAASSRSNTSVSQLGDAILTIGATARSVKGGTVELSTVLGVLADNGIKGAEGGTHLRNIIMSLQSPTKDAALILDQLGINVYDADGNMRSLVDVVGEMQTATEGMDQASRDAIVSGIFNKADVAAVNALLGTSRGRFDELTGAIYNSKNAADQMANVQLDNLAGDITLFNSALEGARIAISDRVTPTLRNFVQSASEGLNQVTKAFKEDGLSGAMQAFGEWLTKAISMIIDTVPTVISAGGQLVVALAKGLVDNLPQMATAAAQVISGLVTGLVQALPGLADGAVRVMASFGAYLHENLPSLIKSGLEIVTSLSGSLRENAGRIIDGAIALALALGQGLIDSIPDIIRNVPTIVSNIAGIINDNAPKVLAAGVQLIGSLVKGLIESVPVIIQEMPKIIAAIWDTITAVNWISLGATLVTGIGNGIKGMFGSVKETAGNLLKTITDAFGNPVKTLYDIGKNLVDGLVSGAKSLITSIPKHIGEIVTSIIDTFKSLFGIHSPSTVMAEIGANVVSGLFNGIKDKWESVKDAIAGFFAAIPGFFSGMPDNLRNAGQAAISGFQTGASAAWDNAKAFFAAVGNGISGSFERLPESFKIIGSNAVSAIASGWNSARNTLSTAMQTVGNGISEWMRNLNNSRDSMGTIGGNLMSGLANGIINAARTAVEAARNAAAAVVNTVKGAFGVASPSKVFHGIGEYLMEGMAGGIEDSSKLVDNAMANVSGKIADFEIPEIQSISTQTRSTAGTNEIYVPRNGNPGGLRDLTVILELDKMQFGKAVYKLNNEETQRVGLRLAGGFA